MAACLFCVWVVLVVCCCLDDFTLWFDCFVLLLDLPIVGGCSWFSILGFVVGLIDLLVRPL